MKKQSCMQLLKKEALYFLGIFIATVIIFQVVFYKESFFVVVRTVFSFFWLFVLPGFVIMLYWQDSLTFLERFVLGTALGGAVVGIASYYLGLAGFHVKYHGFVLPVVMLLFGGYLVWKKSKLKIK